MPTRPMPSGELRRQEFLEEAERERLIDQHFPSAPSNAGEFPYPLGQVLRRAAAACNSSVSGCGRQPSLNRQGQTKESPHAADRLCDALYRSCTPVGPSGNVLRASTTSLSTSITSRVDSNGLIGTLEALPGGEASLPSSDLHVGERLLGDRRHQLWRPPPALFDDW